MSVFCNSSWLHGIILILTKMNVRRRLVYLADLKLFLMKILHNTVPIILIYVIFTYVEAQHIPQIQKWY